MKFSRSKARFRLINVENIRDVYVCIVYMYTRVLDVGTKDRGDATRAKQETPVYIFIDILYFERSLMDLKLIN